MFYTVSLNLAWEEEDFPPGLHLGAGMSAESEEFPTRMVTISVDLMFETIVSSSCSVAAPPASRNSSSEEDGSRARLHHDRLGHGGTPPSETEWVARETANDLQQGPHGHDPTW